MRIQTASDLFLTEVKDLYDAEKQLLRALPRIAKAAGNEELATAMREHVDVTRTQIGRLEQIFEMIGEKAKSHPCKGMKGLVEEAQELMDEGSANAVLDSAIAGAGRKVEHYEMAGYQSAQDTARGLGNQKAAQLLAQSFEEEKEMDRRLKQLSSRLLKSANTNGGAREEQKGRRQAQGSAAGQSKSASGRGRSTAARQQRSSAKSASAKSARGRQSAGGRRTQQNAARGSRNLSQSTTDHEQIREWAEARGAKPASVKGTAGRGRRGYMIRLDFPGYSGGESLQEISWDDFFKQFDENKLALVYQEKTASGQQSNFNKLVKRD